MNKLYTDARATCDNTMIAVTMGDPFTPALIMTPLEAEYLKLQLTKALRQTAAIPSYHSESIGEMYV